MNQVDESAVRTPDAVARRRKRRRGANRHKTAFAAPRALPKPSIVTRFYSRVVANYLSFVNATSPLSCEPAALADVAGRNAPFILVGWHGQGFLVPFIRPPDLPIDILASTSADGEYIARAFETFGWGAVRGSGARSAKKAVRNGGAAAFVAMRRRLDEGVSVCLTADFNKRAPRQVGRGIAMLAQSSGRPIVPAAIATSRRISLKTWDRATINLPFSRAACVFGNLIEVPGSADDAALEKTCRQVEAALNAATMRAYEIVERRHG